MATLLFGDSIAKGITYQNQTLTLTKQPIVNTLKNNFGIHIQNYSVYGQTLKRLHDKKIILHAIEQLDVSEKNYCVIAVGGNDADYDWKKVADAPFEHHESKTPLELFEKLLTDYVIYLKSKDIRVILFTTVPLLSKRYFDEIIKKVGNAERIMQFFNQDVEMISRHHEAYSHVISKVAYTHDCILIDIRTHLLHQENYNDYISSDGVHPNQMGYNLIYQMIKNTVLEDNRLTHLIKFISDEN
jgi:lysophospholipase L1-like esterase